MRKLKRRKVIKEYLEERLEKNQRRIQRIATENYKLRQQLDALNALPVQKPMTKADREALEKAKEDAVIAAEKAASEPVLDTSDQEIGVMPVEETI